MAVTIVSFRWLEILEKEFDKNFVDLDLLIGDLDAEEPDFVHSARQKLAGLSSCFAQLTHKAQTIFQNSAKVEAELIDLRTELVNSRTRQEVLEDDSRNLVLQLHSLQLDRLPSNQNPEQYKEKIETALKLSPSKSSYSEEITFRNNSEVKKLKNELVQYQRENMILRNSILALHSEVYGARLAAKYLDKELAGRIQQLQLLGKEMRTDVRDKLWRQLESEILLHRHKTVIRACRNRTNHEFIPLDSRILNLDHSDAERFLKTGTGNSGRRDSLLKFDGNGTRRTGSEHENHKMMDSLTRKNNINHQNDCSNNNNKSQNGNNNNNHQHNNNNINNNNDEEEDDDTTLSSSTTTTATVPLGNRRTVVSTKGSNNDINNSNSNKGDNVVERKSVEEETGSRRPGSGCIQLDSGGKDVLGESGREKGEDGRRKAEEERKEQKTEGEKKEVREAKGRKEQKKRSTSSDGEEYLCVVGEKRTVIVKRQPGQGLGISITGGREHGVPILISELEAGGPAHECKGLFVGDAILRVNDISLENTSHFEAVKILTNLETNDVKLLVQFIAVDTDEENSLSEDLYGYRYRFFDTEVMDSSDALGLHPLHSKSAHTPTAPRTPESNRSERKNDDQAERFPSRPLDASSPEESRRQIETIDRDIDDKSEKLIEIDGDTGREKGEAEKLEIDLFGFRFRTDIDDVMGNTGTGEDLLEDFLGGKSDPPQRETDLIQMETPADSKASVPSPRKFEYVDENIFSGLEDHSILDNIMKSFSEDDFSYLENPEKEKTLTSDSGLEVCLSGSENDGDTRNYGEKDYLNGWTDNVPEKVELKTLQHIFDRSFSSNLSSPRGSTSFDDDILSTEHSDEKSNSANDFNKGRETRTAASYATKKLQKTSKPPITTTDTMEPTRQRPVYPKTDTSTTIITTTTTSSKGDLSTIKKAKRNAIEAAKRNKCGRKSKETGRKDAKTEKRKNSKDLDGEATKTEESQRKREVNFKMTDRFEENLIEYNVKSFDVNLMASPARRRGIPEVRKDESAGGEDAVVIGGSDELEETRKLSRRYGLKIPGKGVKQDYNSMVVLTEVKSPERCLKVLENHLKHFKTVGENSVKGSNEGVRENSKSKTQYRFNRYESFGDPDFGTPV